MSQIIEKSSYVKACIAITFLSSPLFKRSEKTGKRKYTPGRRKRKGIRISER